jgi:hypothetical protein
MTDTEQETKVEVISLEKFKRAEINALLLGNDGSDTFALTKPLLEARVAADENGDEEHSKLLGFVNDLLNIHLRVDDKAEPFGPMWQSAQGRTCIASDFRGEQNTILAEYASEVEHPVLRARIADIAWYNDRKLGNIGKLAVAAYAEIIELRIAGQLHRTHSDDGYLLDLADIAQRMIHIAARLYKIKAIPELVTSVLTKLSDACVQARSYVAFIKVSEIGLALKVFEWSAVLVGADRIVADTERQDNPMAVQSVWELAERGYGIIGEIDNQKRAQNEIVEQDLKMRKQVGPASAEAHWVRRAIGKLRQYGGQKEWIDKLRGELRDLEEASLDQFGFFSHTLDLTDLATGTIEVFEKLTLPNIFLQFALLVQPQSKTELKKAVDESSEKSVFSSLFGSSYADRDGKVYAQTGAKPESDEGEKDWYKTQSLQHLEIRRRVAVSGQFEPARNWVMTNFPIEQRHFLPIVYHSPFVQDGYHMTFSLGFARLWQGDCISAANLLIPQLENSIRYVLKNSNAYSAKMMSDLTQDDRSLSSLLDHSREEMEKIFGEDLVHEIDLLFNYRPGPALRHQAAHGKMTDGQCYSSDTIYACWLVYYMTCLPLIEHWKDLIGPEIEAQAF